MLSSTHTYLARASGLGVGVGVAVALLISAQPGGAVPDLPASVTFSLAPPGTLAATPAPPARLLDANRLEPGGHTYTAVVRLRNQSGTTLRVGVRTKPDLRSLDGIVRIRVASDGRVLADSTLQGLRRGSAVTVPIRSGAVRLLRVQTWIPGEVTDGYQGRIVRVSLVVTARTAGGRS